MTTWIIDQLSCVRSARAILSSLDLVRPEKWTDAFKTAMHFPSTLDAKKYATHTSAKKCASAAEARLAQRAQRSRTEMGRGWKPLTLRSRRYVSLQSVQEIKQFFQPPEWQQLGEGGGLETAHVVAASCDLCKVPGKYVHARAKRARRES